MIPTFSNFRQGQTTGAASRDSTMIESNRLIYLTPYVLVAVICFLEETLRPEAINSSYLNWLQS
jgi:hypothetical protein